MSDQTAQNAPMTGQHLGMTLNIDAADHENRAFFSHCGAGEFRLQKCGGCGLLRYPPSTACPFCGDPASEWVPVEPHGAVWTYAEVPHAIQPAFREHVPYLIVIVQLDTQQGQPGAEDGIRVAGNLVTPDGAFAGPDLITQVGIGTRMRMVFHPVGDGFALPMWTVDESARQPEPWRYPD